jgi:Putative serine esterase (DUF676)
VFTITMSDGTVARVDGNLDASLPVVVLLHGFGGTSLDMTSPATGRPGLAFTRNLSYPPYKDEGFHYYPPPLPVAGFFVDPPTPTLTSWSQALNAAGFSTVTYSQSAPSGLIAPNVAQLGRLVTEVLTADPRLSGLRVAFVAHSRGGLIARSFLVGATTNPALAPFLSRVTALVTLHSPHLGSGVANLATTIDGLLARLQAAFAAAGTTAPGILAMLRGVVGSPAIMELMVGSPVIAGIAAGEPVPGVAYHTFGGTSPAALRLFANVYTPDSTIPLIPFPFPPFHWGSTPVMVGAPLDALSFAPAAVLAPMPVVTEILTVLGLLAASTPELARGGDLLVSNARAHLPFSASVTGNPLNHAEALWDPTLQAQVVAILARLRSPLVSGQATTRIVPFPASRTPATHTVTATDSVSRAPLTTGTVTVYDPDGGVAVRTGLGMPFTYGFASRRIRVFDPDLRQWTFELQSPTIEVVLPPPYGTVEVDYG